MSNQVPKKEVHIQLDNGQPIHLANGKTIHVTKGKRIQLSKGKTILLEDGRQIQLEIPHPTQAPVPEVNGNTAKPPAPLREENVQEILTAIPHWMIRWGNTLFFSLILLLLLIGWLIKYPDVIPTQATVLSTSTMQEVLLPKGHKVAEVLVSQGQSVGEATPLAVLENTANYQDILQLKTAVQGSQINSQSFYFPLEKLPPLSLGELQSVYAQFEESHYQYLLNKNQIQQSRQRVYQEQTGTPGLHLPRNSLGFFKAVIEDFNQLSSAIDAWEKKYILLSNLDGVVEQVNADIDPKDSQKPILTIQPFDPPEYFAVLKIPFQNSGKIKVAQQVNIKLENYPEMEFGMLQGTITSISESQDQESAYIAKVQLPRQLTTSYQKELHYSNNLVGLGEVITNKRRLLARLIPLGLSF